MTLERLQVEMWRRHTAAMCKVIRSDPPSDDEYRALVELNRRVEAAMRAHPGERDWLPPDPDPEVHRVLQRAQLNYLEAKCFGRLPSEPELPLPPIGTYLRPSVRTDGP